MSIAWWEILLRLVLAALVGGIVGLEREMTGKPAGIRTQALVSLGSALFTILSISALPIGTTDPLRVAAGVVTGVGFLGAGAILREGITVRGLTTAATIWVVCALGMSVGAGLYWIALFAMALVLLALVILHPVEGRFRQNSYAVTLLVTLLKPSLSEILGYFSESNLKVEETEMVAGEGKPVWKFRLIVPSRVKSEEILAALSRFASSFTFTIETSIQA